jgi:RHS repeat-associated protein
MPNLMQPPSKIKSSGQVSCSALSLPMNWVFAFLLFCLPLKLAFAANGCVPAEGPFYTPEYAAQACARDVASIFPNPPWVLYLGCHVYSEVPWGVDGVAGLIEWRAYYYPDPTDQSAEGYQYFCDNKPKPAKNDGCPPKGCSTGDPINAGTGNMYLKETDYTGDRWLTFSRYYNSDVFVTTDTVGSSWRHTYSRNVVYTSSASPPTAVLRHQDGRAITFTQQSGLWVSEPDIQDVLTEQIDGGGNPTGWTYVRADTRNAEHYNASGQLTSIVDAQGFQTTLAYSTSSTPTSIAPAPGYLITVTDPVFRSLQFTYVTLANYAPTIGFLSTMTDPSGQVYQYNYNANGNLTSVSYPGVSTPRTYVYNEPAHTSGSNFPNVLTGVVDENNARYGTFDYDTSTNAIGTQQGAGSEKFTLTYNTDGSTDVVDPQNQTQHHTFQISNSVVLASTVSGPQIGFADAASRTYDGNNNPTSVTDFNGKTVCYTLYDHGLEKSRTEGVVNNASCTTPVTGSRKIQTDWSTSLRLPTQRRIYSANGVEEARTDWIYNTRGQVLTRTQSDPQNASNPVRTWTYTYCNAISASCPVIGLLLSVDGPRTDVSDVTTYAYYQNTDQSGCATLGGVCHNIGDVQKVINALGQMTTYVSYDKNGRATRIQDANGVYTDMTYHARGWLLTRTVRANANGTPNATLDATTTFAYDNVGNVTKVTQPEVPPTTGSYLAYTYDAAHRLIKITDNLGDTIDYCSGGVGSATCLDAAGNRLDEKTKDPSGNLKRELSRQYDQLNRLTHLQNATPTDVQRFANPPPPETPPTGITYTDGYDGNGNAIYSFDGNSIGTEQQYDPLNRLVKTLQDHAGIGATHDTTTQYAYDARNNLRSVIDPDNLTTSYTYDGLNNLTALSSPDTGSTGYTYDAAGNRKTQTDARGVISTYSYDVLNRLAGISYPTTSLNITYGYDQVATGCYNVGRLTAMTDHAGTTTYCYDQRGNVLKKVQTTADATGYFATQYQYTLADRLASLSYPSGAIVTYSRDSVGRITSVVYKANATASPINLVSSATYLPFGPLNVLNFGNGRSLTKSYDNDYAIDKVASSSSSASPLVIDATVDVLGNLINASSTAGASPPTQRYQYDPLYRLTNVQYGNTSLLTLDYFPTGDRKTKTPQGQSAQSYTYTSGTHRLASVAGVSRSYDADGNTSVLNGSALTYDNRNRVSVNGTTTFDYNGRGERVAKIDPTTSPVKGAIVGPIAYHYLENGALVSEWSQIWTCSGISQGASIGTSKALVHDGGATRAVGVQPCPDPTQTLVPVWQPGTDYIYLDSVLVGVAKGGILYYVETDQLGTPRQVIKPGATTAADTLMWKWDYFANNSAFGENAPSVQTLTFNLRFPGQYFDSETGLNYNYFRDYEPGTGRYVESDPIGLGGGVASYGYALANPLAADDMLGLSVTGSWMKDPIVNIQNYGVTGWTLVTPSWSWWGYLRFVRAFGYANGYVNMDIACNDDCSKKTWELHRTIGVSASGSFDFGPNLYALAISRGYGLAAGMGANATLAGGDLLTAELHFVGLMGQKGSAIVSALSAYGPTAICLGFSPPQ